MQRHANGAAQAEVAHDRGRQDRGGASGQRLGALEKDVEPVEPLPVGAGDAAAAAEPQNAHQDLDRHVIRLHLDMTVSLSEESEVERILRDLQGTDATHGRAGILVVDRANLHLEVGSGDAFPDDLPAVLKDTVDRLDRLIADATDESERSRATRALAHLYKLLQSHYATGGRGL